MEATAVKSVVVRPEVEENLEVATALPEGKELGAAGRQGIPSWTCHWHARSWCSRRSVSPSGGVGKYYLRLSSLDLAALL